MLTKIVVNSPKGNWSAVTIEDPLTPDCKWQLFESGKKNISKRGTANEIIEHCNN